VYLVECSDHSLYCGISKTVILRINVHNSGKGAKYTRSRLPVILLYKEEVASKSEALRREYTIKKLSRKKKEEMVKLSKSVYNQHISRDKESCDVYQEEEQLVQDPCHVKGCTEAAHKKVILSSKVIVNNNEKQIKQKVCLCHEHYDSIVKGSNTGYSVGCRTPESTLKYSLNSPH
jgi:putative endonuclease